MAKITSKSNKKTSNGNILTIKNNAYVIKKDLYKKWLIASGILNFMLLTYSILTTIR